MRDKVSRSPIHLTAVKRHGCALFIACLIARCAFVRADSTTLSVTAAGLPPASAFVSAAATNDWLLDATFAGRLFQRGANDHELVLDNGLLRRTFRLTPNAATIGVDNRMTGASVLRAVEPEALVTIDGKEFEIGGLRGQTDRAYLLPEWVERLTNNPAAFQFAGFSVGTPAAPFNWRRKRHSAELPWPNPGVSVDFVFRDPTPRPATSR